MHAIVIDRGPEKGRSATVKTGADLVVGREATATLCISDSMSSRRHIRFFIGPDNQCWVEDLGSRNGTFMNGEKLVGKKPCQPGDKITIGETLLSVLEKTEDIKKDKLVGHKVGGYHILERLGRGGMGTVYKATQLNLDRVVALKILSREWNDVAFVEKFRGEARAAGALNHPNIIQVYDVGSEEVKNGVLNYFSMEFAPGGSVQDVLNQRTKLPVPEALPLLIDAARGLEYAEKKQIVHRDIKPDNLMIGEGNVIKIGDLGLAQRADGNEQADKESKIFGTPHYVSPEQIKGEKVDTRADIYSLGATTYRILTGRTPFEGSNVKEIIVKQVREEPPDIRQVEPSVPEELAKVVARMMKKDPAERYQHVEELLADLKGVSTELEPAAPESEGPRARQRPAPARRSALPLGAALIVIVLAVGGIVLVNSLMGGNGGENKGTQEPKQGPDPQTGQYERELKAQIALGDLDRKYPRDRAPTQGQAQEYKKLAEQYPETKYGKDAKSRAEEIEKQFAHDRLKRAAEAYQKADKLWKGPPVTVPSLIDAKRAFGEIVKDFPGTEQASRAEEALKKLDLEIEALKKQGDTYLEEMKRALPRVGELVKENRYGEAIKVFQELLGRFSDPEIQDKLKLEIKKYQEDAATRWRSDREAAEGHRAKGQYEDAIRVIEPARSFGIEAIVREADELVRRYKKEQQDQRERLAARSLEEDADLYERTADAAEKHFAELRFEEAHKEAALAAEKLQTPEYKALHAGLLKELEAAGNLLRMRAERGWGKAMRFEIPPDVAGTNYEPVGEILRLEQARGVWKLVVRAHLRGVPSGTGSVSVLLARLSSDKLLDLLAGPAGDPSPEMRLAAIGWTLAHWQHDAARQRIAQTRPVAGTELLGEKLRAWEARLKEIDRHVEREAARCRRLYQAGQWEACLAIFKRLKRRYAGTEAWQKVK